MQNKALALALLLILGFASIAEAQTQSVLPNAMTQFSDGNGAPYSGGKVYFYVPGTTTPKSTWQDPNGNTLNTNPVILDGNGRAIIWGSGQYRQVLQDQFGNTIWDQLTLQINPGILLNLAGQSLVGNPASSSGPLQAITVGNGLTLSSGGVLSANGTTYNVVVDAANQAVTSGFQSQQRVATTALTYTLPLGSGLFNGFGFWIYATGGTVTVTPNAADQFNGQALGASITIANGSVAFVSTNGASPATWYERLITNGAGAQTVASGAISGYLPSSIAGSNTTGSMTVAAGQAADSTGASYISFGTSHSWLVSNGNAADGYQGGTTLPNSTTIHMFDCHGTAGDTSFASTSLTPTCPTNYNSLYRRVFSFYTNSSGAPVAFNADETEGGALTAFLSGSLVTDINGSTLSTANRTLYSMSVPTGVKVAWMGNIQIAGFGASYFLWITSPDEPDSTAGVGGVNGAIFDQGTTAGSVLQTTATRRRTITDTSGRIGLRANNSMTAYAVTVGWVDFRRN